MPKPVTYINATIPAGADGLSGVIDLCALTLLGIHVPGTWRDSVAYVSFQASLDGVAFANVYRTDGQPVTRRVEPGGFSGISPTTLMGARYLKIRSGHPALPIDQLTDQVLNLAVRELQ